MKKIISTFLIASAFMLSSVVPASASPASEETWDTGFEEFYDSEGYFELVEPAASSAIAPCRRGTIRVSTKKKLLHSAVAGGIGAAIGAGVGGKRGAAIGVGSGAGGYLLYRYVKDRKGRCVRRYVGRG